MRSPRSLSRASRRAVAGLSDGTPERSSASTTATIAGNDPPTADPGGPYSADVGVDINFDGGEAGFDSLNIEGGEFDADMILFMPGMTGNQWFDNTDLPRSEGGLIRADRHCRAEGMQRVYVAGDSGSFPGPDWLPKQAHMADLQAAAAAGPRRAGGVCVRGDGGARSDGCSELVRGGRGRGRRDGRRSAG